MMRLEDTRNGAPGANRLEAGSLTRQEDVLLQKFRRARELSVQGHRVSLSIMFYADEGLCDMTIEDRERILPAVKTESRKEVK